MNIAFFCGGGGSGRIRGKQIGKYLGAKVNPEEGYEHDICIYVKTQPPENHPRNTYLDIVDEPKRVSWLKEHTDVKVIASSLTAYEFLTSSLSNEVVLIPQHHCNYERITKTEEGNSYGVVGKGGAIQNENIPKLFKNFNWVKDYRNRADVIKGYEKIDIQIIWRPMDRPLKNPLKIVNAMSLGIPTIAYPEMAYKEIEGYYTRCNKIEDLITKPKYDKKALIEKAEEYHIDNISKLYRGL